MYTDPILLLTHTWLNNSRWKQHKNGISGLHKKLIKLILKANFILQCPSDDKAMFIDQDPFCVQLINKDDQMHIMECCGSHTYIDDCNCLECDLRLIFLYIFYVFQMYFNQI